MNSPTTGGGVFSLSTYWVPSVAFAGLVLRYMPCSIWGYLKRLFTFDGGDKLIEFQSRVREFEEERRRLENVNRELTEENRGLKTENAKLSGLLQKANEEYKRLQNQLQQARDGTAATQRSLEKEKQEAAKAKAAHQEDVNALKRQLEVKKSEIAGAKNDLQRSQAKLDDVTALLETRSRELKSAQVFLTTADTHSGAEVISLIDALNAEILQTCAFIADSFEFARKPEHATEIKEGCTRISELMGPTMTHLLSTIQHGADPLLVQVALQGATAEFSRWIIMTWDFDGLQAEQPLAEIYHDVRSSETQAISGRWRALTRAHAQKVSLQQDDVHSTMVTHISDTLVVTMVAAGCTKNYADVYREFTQKFGERVSNIVKMAVRLNKVMGEEVTSADLWPTHGAAGDKFDSAAMEDFESQVEDQTEKPVLCTTALGLYRSEKVGVGDAFEFKNAVLKKAKVALESIADGLDREDATP
ncbi:hypothetical protein ID866_4310 [Astraeus odoratus]|nr:hypothetical protein ID866_4310 [Astraeus odoratus]